MDNVASLKYFTAELALIAGVLLIIVWDLLAKGRAKITGIVAISGVALSISAAVGVRALISEDPPVTLFYGLLAFDRYANLFRVLFAFITAIVILISIPSDELAPKSAEDAEDDAKLGPLARFRRDPGEFFALLLVLTLGMGLMSSSRNLLMIYLSLEIVSVLSFVMAGLKFQDAKSSGRAHV
mgnify:CR=1 FL=1